METTRVGKGNNFSHYFCACFGESRFGIRLWSDDVPQNLVGSGHAYVSGTPTRA